MKAVFENSASGAGSLAGRPRDRAAAVQRVGKPGQRRALVELRQGALETVLAEIGAARECRRAGRSSRVRRSVPMVWLPCASSAAVSTGSEMPSASNTSMPANLRYGADRVERGWREKS